MYIYFSRAEKEKWKHAVFFIIFTCAFHFGSGTEK